jgi:hypothetical protein
VLDGNREPHPRWRGALLPIAQRGGREPELVCELRLADTHPRADLAHIDFGEFDQRNAGPCILFFRPAERMSRPRTLLEELCALALAIGADSMHVEYKDRREWVIANKGQTRIPMASYPSSSADGKLLRGNLYALTKKPRRTVIGGKVYILRVRTYDSFGEDAFTVSITPAPETDPSVTPSFTAKQGQYLALIHNYTRIHGRAPAEADLQRYFRVSPPTVHDMIKTLERNGLIERSSGQARSIRLRVPPKALPRLE